MLLKTFSSTVSVGLQTVLGAHPQLPTLLLRCTSAAGLMQVRGAKRKFGGITIDAERARKRKHKLSNYHKKQPLMSEFRMRKKIDLPYLVTSLNQVISPIIPLEKHAKAPLHTRLGARQRLTASKEWWLDAYSGGVIKRRLKKIGHYVTSMEFARQAQNDFIAANKALQNGDKQTLRTLLTENASEVLLQEFAHKKEFTWEFVGELERPRVVRARVAPFNTKENLFAQMVVRLKYMRLMAAYGPTGKLVRGDPDHPTEVISYVVLERHLLEPERSSWRIMTLLPPQRPWREVIAEEEERKRSSADAAVPRPVAVN